MRVLKQRPRRRCARRRCAAAGLVFCAPGGAGALLLQERAEGEVALPGRADRREREENFLLKSRKDATLDGRHLPLLAKTARRDAPNPATNPEQRQEDGGNKRTAPLDKKVQAASALQMTDAELDRIDKKMLDYKLDKPLCPYSVDYVSGDYWLGDLCQLSLARGAYPTEQSDEALLAAAFADVNPDNWKDGHKGEAITHEIVGHASKHCAAAYNLAKFVQGILTRKPLKATAEEKKRLKALGAEDAKELKSLVEKNYKGKGFATNTDGGKVNLDWDELKPTSYDVTQNYAWMCAMICDFLDGKDDGQEGKTECVAYSSSDAHYKNNPHWCWLKSSYHSKSDTKFKDHIYSSVCIDRACKVKSYTKDDPPRPVLESYDKKDPDGCVSRYPELFLQPQDCVKSDSEWEEDPECPKCIAEGKEGKGKRRRKVTTEAQFGGKCDNDWEEFDCKKVHDTKPCDPENPPVDCELGDWDDPPEEHRCPKCGVNKKGKRRRVVKTEPKHGGTCDNDLQEFDCTEVENTQACPICGIGWLYLGLIIGGGVLLLILCIVLIVCCRRGKKKTVVQTRKTATAPGEDGVLSSMASVPAGERLKSQAASNRAAGGGTLGGGEETLESEEKHMDSGMEEDDE